MSTLPGMDHAVQDEPRREHARKIIRECGRVLVACSGGVDSVLVAAVAAAELGERAVAATAISESLATQEREAVRQVVRALGLRHLEIETNELDDPSYVANDGNRCFHCKDIAYTAFLGAAEREGVHVVLDGTNADDLADIRPGRRAAQLHGVRSPLAEAGLDKRAVRAWARELGLSVWDKPAAACLSSRIPYGSPVTREKLARIDRAERALHDLGFRQCRVRAHDDVARIEVERERLADAVALHEHIAQAMREAGFTWAALDLEGFRSGNLNRTLPVVPSHD